MKDLFAKCYEPQRQDYLRDKGIYPFFHYLETRQGPEVIMEGKRKIMLGSNNYLGLTSSPDVIDATIETIRQYGTGCSGSRFLNGTLKIHLELEKELAEFLHKEDCMLFPSGFQANLGIIAGVCGLGDVVIIDRDVHASIYDGCKLCGAKVMRFFHNDIEDLEKQLMKVPEDAGCLVVADGVYSMSGDIADLPGICGMAKKYGARVMLDDAHGLGVLGEGGRGLSSHFGLEDQVDIIMGTFSKSLASIGGFMAADARIIDYARHASRPFVFAAATAPSQTASALAALRHIKEHPEEITHLFELASLFRKELKDRGVKIIDAPTPIVPIYTYETERTLRIVRKIYDAGVYVNSVLPPAVAEGQCLIRTSLMTTLTPELIREAAEIIAKVVLAEEE